MLKSCVFFCPCRYVILHVSDITVFVTVHDVKFLLYKLPLTCEETDLIRTLQMSLQIHV